jgi:HPr Serine kinase C-terminal domain
VATQQSAFGLNLRGSLTPPGLPDALPGLPELELRMVGGDDLDAAWSGPATPGSWRGTLRDGAELTIRWGREGELLFGYGEEARYLLDAGAERLLCAPAEPSSLSWQRALLSRVLPVVAIACGYEALHAAAVRTPVGVVAVVGASGAGKSTLAAELLRRGHRLVGDDVLVIGRSADRIVGFPGGAHLSLEPGGEEGLDAEVLGELGGKLWAVVGESASDPAPVAAIVLLERGEGPVEAQELAPSPLTLAPFMLGLPDEEGRDGERFALYADLVEAGRLLRLSGAATAPASEFAEALEFAVGAPALATAEAGR